MVKTGKGTETLTWTTMASSWGNTLVLVSDRGIRALLPGFAGDWTIVQKRFPGARFAQADTTRVSAVTDGIAKIFANPLIRVLIPLDPAGTAFQSLVWRALRGIPPGATMTYAELARKIHRPRAHRAVASACAANPVAVLIPCHRVVPANGSLGGYRWGTKMKAELLEMESGRHMAAPILQTGFSR